MPHSDEELRALAEFYDHTDTSTLDGEEIQWEPPPPDVIVRRSVGLRHADMDRLRHIAKNEGIGVGALMARWVLERLDREENPARTSGSVVMTMLPNAAPMGADAERVVQAVMASRCAPRWYH